MASHATALAEQVLAVVDGLPLHIAAGQHHVGSVAVLATSLRVLLGKQRPQPVLVISVRFLNAGSGTSVALVARRTAEFFRVVYLQQLRFGMAAESIGILVGLLLALGGHRGGSDFQWLPLIHVTGLATVHDIRFRHIDLHNRWNPLGGAFLQPFDLLRRHIDHMVGDVLVHLCPGGGYRLQHLAEFQAQLRALVANLVVSLLQLRKCIFLPASVRKFHRRLFAFVLINLFSFTCFR